MRRLSLLLLVVWLGGTLSPVSARGGSGGGVWSIWLWNFDQQRLLRLIEGGGRFQAEDVPLPLPEGYQFGGIVELSGPSLLVCMKPNTTATGATDAMFGVYDYEAGQFLSEPKSFGGLAACGPDNIYDPARSYYIVGVMTANHQWVVNVLDVTTGEVVYSLSKDQADPDGTISNVPVVIKVNGNTVWLALMPPANETTASEIPLVEWQMGDDHVKLLFTYPTSIIQLLFNGEALSFNSASDTILYQWRNGPSFPIFSVPGFAIQYSHFIESARKVLVYGTDADNMPHVFVIDRMADVTELDSTLAGYVIPTSDGFISLTHPDGKGTEGRAVRFGEDGSAEDPVLVWSDPTSAHWIPVEYPALGIERGLVLFHLAR